MLRAQGQDVAKRRAQRCITAPAVSPQQAKDRAGMKKWPAPPFMPSASIGWICRNTPAPRLRAVRPLQERHIPVGKAVFLDQLALNCACLGCNAKTPLGVVSLAENLIMAAMVAAMLAGG